MRTPRIHVRPKKNRRPKKKSTAKITINVDDTTNASYLTWHDTWYAGTFQIADPVFAAHENRWKQACETNRKLDGAPACRSDEHAGADARIRWRKETKSQFQATTPTGAQRYLRCPNAQARSPSITPANNKRIAGTVHRTSTKFLERLGPAVGPEHARRARTWRLVRTTLPQHYATKNIPPARLAATGLRPLNDLLGGSNFAAVPLVVSSRGSAKAGLERSPFCLQFAQHRSLQLLSRSSHHQPTRFLLLATISSQVASNGKPSPSVALEIRRRAAVRLSASR